MKNWRIVITTFLFVPIFFAAPYFSIAQTAAEHASHHPKASTAGPDSTAGMKSKADTSTGGMAGGMGDMMKEMGKNPGKELYPAMMEQPDMSAEKRDEIIRLSDERISQGEMLLSTGLEKLKRAAEAQDFSAMQKANEEIRTGKALFTSGLAAKQALAENIDPRVTALQWFRSEMNLPQPKVKQPHGFFGLSGFHYITMLTFFLFAVVMIWMYFHKMKRANALVEKLTGKSGDKTPTPGGAPPAAPVKRGPIAPTPAPGAAPPATPGKTDAAAAKPAPAADKPPVVNVDIPPSKPNSWTGTLLVSEIFDETPNVKTFRLTEPASGKIPFNYLPGQFITVTINPKGVPVKRSYTIASSPTRHDYCEITVKHEEKGTVSHYMHTEVHIGELMQFTAPSGKFTFTEAHAESAVFIAGGVGVTPMMSAIRYLTDRSWKGEIYFFFLCKDESNIIFREEIVYLQKRYPNFHVFFVLSQMKGESKDGFISGHITKEILAEHVPDITTRMTHICGPAPMMDAVKKMLEELKVPKELVMVEVFSGPPPAAKIAPTPPAEGQKAPDPNAPPKLVDEKAAPPEEAIKTPPTDEAAKTETIPAEGKAAPESGTATVTFSKSNKTAVLTEDKSVLEASEDAGVNIDYSCRVGTCGICKTKLISGKVTMAVQDALTQEDKVQNIILACQAKANEDVNVDA